MSKSKINPKAIKIKTVLFQRIGRGLLWTLIFFLLLKGVSSIFSPNELGEAQRYVEGFINERSHRETVEREAAAFAEKFALEYFTYERGDDHEQRVRRYMSSSVSIPSKGHGRLRALNARSYGITWYSENQVNVKVAVQVMYDIISNEGDGPGRSVVENIYVIVPVMEKDGRYMVEDHPAIIPPPEKAEVSNQFFSAVGVDSNTSNELREVIDNFFKTYYSGSPAALRYYMADGVRIRGLEDRFRFNRIENFRAFEGEAKDEYLIIVEITIIDAISNLTYRQGYHITLVKKNNRYYIRDFQVRTVNINL